MGASLRSDIMATIAILVLACIAAVSAKTYLKEEFGAGWEDRWVVSDWKKSEGQAGTWDVTAGDWYGDAEADKGLHTSEDARFYAISAKHEDFSYKGKNLLTKKDIRCESDELTHLYTLIVKPDNTYEVQIDLKEVASGSLLDDWDFLEPKEIKDPALSKPSDWVDEKKIDDPEDKKPDGWDDIPKQVSDPEASKPEDWDD